MVNAKDIALINKKSKKYNGEIYIYNPPTTTISTTSTTKTTTTTEPTTTEPTTTTTTTTEPTTTKPMDTTCKTEFDIDGIWNYYIVTYENRNKNYTTNQKINEVNDFLSKAYNGEQTVDYSMYSYELSPIIYKNYKFIYDKTIPEYTILDSYKLNKNYYSETELNNLIKIQTDGSTNYVANSLLSVDKKIYSNNPDIPISFSHTRKIVTSCPI